MSKSCKCKKAAECEECPEWIFTFADLVMLMMGFFVILWVLKPAPGKSSSDAADEKWLEVVARIREAFNYVPNPDSKDPVDLRILMKKLEQLEPPFKGPGKGGETKEIRKGAIGTDPRVTVLRPGIYAASGGKMLFAPGDATLSDETRRVLDDVTQILKGYRNIVQVKGHVSLDDLPEGATPEQQMELSYRRAQAAAEYLVGHGVLRDTVRVQGCATFEPVVQRVYTPDAQVLNRRVEVEATDMLVQERQDQSQPSAAPLSAAPSAPAGAVAESR